MLLQLPTAWLAGMLVVNICRTVQLHFPGIFLQNPNFSHIRFTHVVAALWQQILFPHYRQCSNHPSFLGCLDCIKDRKK